jgi:hypothetical protein
MRRHPSTLAPFGLVLLLSVTPTRASNADTLFRMNGDPGDYITGGQTYFFIPPAASFSLSTGAGAHVGVSSTTDGWTLDFAGLGHRTLRAGVYLRAVRYPFESLQGNGLDVSGDGRGCNTIAGSFRVREAVYDAGGALTRFWATFEQHCEGGTSKASGEIRVNADTALYVQPPADVWVARATSTHFDVQAVDTRGLAVTLSASGLPSGATFVDHGDGTGTFTWPGSADTTSVLVTFLAHSTDGATATGGTMLHVFGNDMLTMTSDPGDYIGAGRTYTFGDTNATFGASVNSQNGVSLSLTSGDEWWYLDFSGPVNTPLSPGTYTGATRYPFNSPGPGLSVYGDGRGCNTDTGQFTVLQIRTSGGAVTQFWATFEQHCEGQTPALQGEIRIGVDVPVATQLALVRAEALPGHNHLEWFAADAVDHTMTVERNAGSGWAPSATVSADGRGFVAFDDTGISPGARLGYRLAYTDGGSTLHTAETWLTSPAGPALALEGPRPNPARGDFMVAFELPDARPAYLELLDVAGRRVLDEEVGMLGSGQHVLRLRSASDLLPGTYWLRLRQGSETRTRTVIIVR